jgi:hypothetical protein
MKIYICRNQFFKRCNCTYDVDKNHHPNNLDCPNYKPMGFVYIELDEKEKDERRKKQPPSQDEGSRRKNK